MSRVLAIWLDGFDMELADRWELPHLAQLASRSTVVPLDSGTVHLSGLTGEHLVTGLDPEAAVRSSAVTFDPTTYACYQRGAFVPSALGDVPTVVLDPCYLDIATTPETVSGVVDWGAHDPGGAPSERPDGLHDEIVERFGAYPAGRFKYATPWASPDDCAEMGARLTEAVNTRSRIGRWLLSERLPEWQLAIVGVSESHSAIEGLYHGIDPNHPLGDAPSAGAAGTGLRDVYEAIDDLVGELTTAFPDADHVVFSMHGMGANNSDVASMVLLGELLRRWSGDPTPDPVWDEVVDGIPRLRPGESWTSAVRRSLHGPPTPRPAASRVARRLARPARKLLRRLWAAPPASVRPAGSHSLEWIPAMWHRAAWPSMRAFALPSFYDGRIRVNLEGREANGLVSVGDYTAVLDEIEKVLTECRDVLTGAPVVEAFDRPFDDPLQVDPTAADLVVRWAGLALGFDHPRFGRIGPFPPRRTGGHSSPRGRCLIRSSRLDVAEHSPRSPFDVLPTLLELSGSSVPEGLSGDSLLATTVH